MSILTNLVVLGVFKYANFFLESLRYAFDSVGVDITTLRLEIILPVGISFYTFQSMSYLIDIYRGKITPTRSPIAFFAYVAFFPQLVAGPIERASHLLPQFLVNRRFSLPLAADGCRQILWGMFKKLFIADRLALYVDLIFQTPQSYNSGELFFAAISFGFQIYCDFSAYSDIAIGTAKLFGFDISRNFAYPYLATNIRDFWKRWHISLTSWFRDYVYVPLGGNRGSPTRRYANVLAVFVLSGLWHGAQWTFVIWGLLHGLYYLLSDFLHRQAAKFSAAWAPTRATRAGMRIGTILATALEAALTFIVVMAAWAFFRAQSVQDAWLIVSSLSDAKLPWQIAAVIAHQPRLTTSMILLLLIEYAQHKVRDREVHQIQDWPRPARWAIYAVLCFLVAVFFPRNRVEFIYFQF